MAKVGTPGWGEPWGRQGGITQWVGRRNKVPQVPLHQPDTHRFSLPTACSQPPWCPWVAGGWGMGLCIGAGSAGKLPGTSLSQQAKVKLIPRGQLCLSGRACPAALRLSRGTNPLWGLEGLSHTVRRVRGSPQVTTVRRSGLGGCRAPGRHKSPGRRGWDVIMTFRARQRFSNLNWRCWWAGFQEKAQLFSSPCCFPGWDQEWCGNVPYHGTLQQRCHRAAWR